MKPIKITQENTDKIKATLDAVNGRAIGHTYTHAYQILRLAIDAECALASLGLAKGERVGASVTFQSGEHLPAAYKYVARTTTVTLLRRTSAWYLAVVRSSELHPRSNPRQSTVLTEAQDSVLVAALRKKYLILAASKIEVAA